jgi:hypothetical protein
MYVALVKGSKNTACIGRDNLDRIFRKLRLALFWRMCRLPIGPSSLWAGIGGLVSHFAVRNVWPRKSGCGNRVGEFAVVAAPVMASFWPVFDRVPASRGQVGEITGVASDPPGWTCVL